MEEVAVKAADKAPRRKSATLALAALGDQLDSGSESDADGGRSEAETEAAMRKGHIGVSRTYGKTTRTRKRSATTLEDARVVQKSKKARSPSMPESTSVKAISLLSASVPAPESISVASSRPRPRPRPVTKKSTLATLPPLVVSTSSLLDTGDLSDLTPLSSDGSSDQVEIISCIQNTRPIASTSASASSPSVIKPSSAFAKKPKEPAWSVTMLKTYVWVLMEPKTWRVYDREEGEEDGVEGLWWPGKIINALKTDIPLKVELFGLGGKSVLIKTPSEGNILSKDRRFIPRFRRPTFISSYPNSTSVPKKKQKLDRDQIETRWKAAVEEMGVDDEARRNNDDTDDDFPEPINMYEYLTAPVSKSISAPPKLVFPKDTSKVPTKNKGKRKRKEVSETSADEHQGSYVNKKEEEKWDEVDDELDLPGELVLGRDGPSKDIDYWPAKLDNYIPPMKPNQAGKYTLTWLDGTTGQIPRPWFYIMSEYEFATCKLGKFHSAIMEVQNDYADDEILHEHDLARRSPSPIPLDTPPSATDFIQLSIRKQFVYTKTVLKAIMDNTYAPSKHKHARFMKGGKFRQSVVDDASLRGRMDPRDVEHLQIYIREWCLRDEGRPGILHSNGLSSGEQSLIEIDADIASTNLEERREILVEPSLDSVMNSDEKRFTSPVPTEASPSSPVPMPPSSLPPPAAELEAEDSIASIAPSVVLASDDGLPPLSPTATTSVATEPLTIDAVDDVVDLAIAEDVISQPQPQSPWYDREDFKSLSALEKVDYCVNILLPEAVRQILLWRNGARTSIDLLSPEEEQDLYEQGDVLLQERDWVNDIIRYRRAMEKTLQGKKRSSQRQNGHNRTGSTSRPRRNIVVPNYQE